MKVKIGDIVKFPHAHRRSSQAPYYLGIVVDESSYYKGSHVRDVVTVCWFSRIEYDEKPSACDILSDVNTHRIKLISRLTT